MKIIFKKIDKKIKNMVAEILYFFVIKFNKFPKVKSIDGTIEKIINDKCSISRFGDGEMRLLGNDSNLNFQEKNKELANRLKEVLTSDDEKILIGLPPVFTYKDMKNITEESKLFWKKDVVLNIKKYKNIKVDKIYYNACITRPYIRLQDKRESKKIFEQLKNIWKNKDIVIIEGEFTKLGIGNDLFDNTKSISRILCPSKNAFSKYNEILEECKKISKDKLLLIALGPTATVLSYDLGKEGYQAIDIGHIDIEYEWFIQGVTDRVEIKGKYTNEVKDGDNVENIVNEQYNSQIMCKIV